MADLILDFLLLRRHPPPRGLARLWAPADPGERAGLRAVEDSVFVRFEVRSQVARHEVEQVEAPASAQARERFVSAATPDAGQALGMRESVQRFALARTLRVATCPACQGKGSVPCDACQGKGAPACPECQGKGQRKDPRCQGEGRVATWTQETFSWTVLRHQVELQPVQPPQPLVREAVDRWLATHDETIPGLEPEQVAAHLGDPSPAAQAIVQAARLELSRVRQEVATGPGRVTEQQVAAWLIPCGYLLQAGSQPRWHWQVGRGDQAITWGPPPVREQTPIAGALAMGALVPFALDAVVRGLGLPWPSLARLWTGFAAVPASLQVAAVLLAWLILGLVVVDPLRRPPGLRVVAVLATQGRTSYLPLLAAVGSLLRAWDVTDRLYADQALALSESPSPAHREALALTLRIPGFGPLRLVEVAWPQALSDDQLVAMLRTVDGVLVHGPPGAVTQDIQARIALHSPPGSPPPVMRMGTVQDLEGWRAAWIDPTCPAPDWRSVLGTLWAPIQALLGAPALSLPPSRSEPS